MFPFLVFCVSLGFLIPGAVGARPIEQFKNPPDASTKPESAGKNPVYKVGDRVEFSWTTNADKVDLYILQGSDRGGGVTIDTGKQSADWSRFRLRPLLMPPRCYRQLIQMESHDQRQ